MVVEYECPKCRKVVSFEQYKLNRFCPDCGTSLCQCRQAKYWMFQFNPKRYRWFDWSEEDRETEQWLTSQHAEDIRKGDKVAIWASDPRAGVYAIGEIVMNPRKEPLAPEQRKYWRIKEDVYKFLVKKSVIVKYLRIITDKPLLKYECEKDSILSDMSVLKGRQATNLRLTKRQWNRILELIEQKRQSTE